MIDAMKNDVITIDGPTASGKGTVAQLVAQKLGFHYLDSGALYRLTALSALRNKVELDDATALASIAARLACRFDGDKIWLGADEVSQHIRAEEIGIAASRLAVFSEVRTALLALQKSFLQAPGLVADGRDMGTVVFPGATVKLFLTASAETSAKRRYKQLIDKGVCASMSDLLRDLTERDARDTGRSSAPLVAAEGAYLLDTSELTIEQAVAQVLQQYSERKKIG